MRINKYLADCGVASRRKCDELISQGKVKVNGKVTRELGVDIKPTDVVLFENRVVRPTVRRVYYKLHKPKGYVTTASDEKGRKTVVELMRKVQERVYPIGRLDYDTEGLLILTNDGDITNILTHPKNAVKKTYIATVEGDVTPEDVKKISKGIDIGGYTTQPCSITIKEKDDKFTRVEVIISEGKNHQVKKMFEAVGKTVAFLKRTSIGEIKLGGLARGEYKALTTKEIAYLKSLQK
ncbi:MAG: rRNA pseudouridine synthase [Clostridia bacterium]|nr:rRNA pseudouridine synthase [Clostridia bacterium]